MSVSDVSNLFGFAGGLGMFLYGMRIMGDGMQKTAGSKMSHFLGMVTNNRFLGVVLGALITAILHSSAATTVMVVGFVNAGILNLTQAVGVIMGANIGTTITAWMVSLNQLGDAFSVLQPSFFAPLCIGIGSFMIVFSKKQNMNLIGEIVSGVGLLFVGLEFMSGSIAPYTDAPIFAQAFAIMGRNPILGILTGALVTAVIQSSTASVGILQTLAMNGIVTTGAAIYITLGQNIGTCLTAMLSSAGANRTAKRAAAIHLTFNTMGAVIFGIGMFALSMLRPEAASAHISSVQISMFHTIFNVMNTLLLYPFANQLVKISGLIVKDKEDGSEAEAGNAGETTQALRHLDQRIFESPMFAIEVAQMETVHMGQIALNNIRLASEAIENRDPETIEKVYKNEKDIDRMEELLTGYLIKVNNLSLTERQKLLVNNLFYSITDIERVGDHCENLAEQAEYMAQHGISFSETGSCDLRAISEKAVKSFTHAVAARQTGDMDDVRKVSQYEDDVDMLEEELRDKHIERLSRGECQPSSGVVFLDIISNLERISDHAYNLAGYVKDEM
ncbi:Na/Pi cotransporter family protein [Otoolea muris]|uniref:Na/Pi cotransporter family protein n=1 Tax=Otoolea muris TaxID=2941515 RepID=UPI00203B02EC|nr:Na/Pi cotransporter family protein [Otoolea muris]